MDFILSGHMNVKNKDGLPKAMTEANHPIMHSDASYSERNKAQRGEKKLSPIGESPSTCPFLRPDLEVIKLLSCSTHFSIKF